MRSGRSSSVTLRRSYDNGGQATKDLPAVVSDLEEIRR